jgi:hypothetical protein
VYIFLYIFVIILSSPRMDAERDKLPVPKGTVFAQKRKFERWLLHFPVLRGYFRLYLRVDKPDAGVGDGGISHAFGFVFAFDFREETFTVLRVKKAAHGRVPAKHTVRLLRFAAGGKVAFKVVQRGGPPLPGVLLDLSRHPSANQSILP